MKWIAFAIVITIAVTTLNYGGIELWSWQRWVIIGCLIAAYSIGYLSGRLTERMA